MADRLTPDQVNDLVGRWKQGDLGARNEVAAKNLGLVTRIAGSYRHYAPEDFDDLVAEGGIGLLRAIDRFDPALKILFSTYASWWIKQAIRSYLSEQRPMVRLPRHAVEVRAKYVKTKQILEYRGQAPMDEDVFAAAGFDETRRKFFADNRSAMLGQCFRFGDRQFPADYDPPEEVHGEPVDDPEYPDELKAWLRQAMQCLRPRQQMILMQRFGIAGPTLDLRRIGRIHGISKERVRQILDISLRELSGLIPDRLISYALKPLTPIEADYRPDRRGRNPKQPARTLTHDGLTLTYLQWARRIGVTYDTIRSRVEKQLHIDQILAPLRVG